MLRRLKSKERSSVEVIRDYLNNANCLTSDMADLLDKVDDADLLKPAFDYMSYYKYKFNTEVVRFILTNADCATAVAVSITELSRKFSLSNDEREGLVRAFMANFPAAKQPFIATEAKVVKYAELMSYRQDAKEDLPDLVAAFVDADFDYRLAAHLEVLIKFSLYHVQHLPQIFDALKVLTSYSHKHKVPENEFPAALQFIYANPARSKPMMELLRHFGLHAEEINMAAILRLNDRQFANFYYMVEGCMPHFLCTKQNINRVLENINAISPGIAVMQVLHRLWQLSSYKSRDKVLNQNRFNFVMYNLSQMHRLAGLQSLVDSTNDYTSYDPAPVDTLRIAAVLDHIEYAQNLIFALVQLNLACKANNYRYEDMCATADAALQSPQIARQIVSTVLQELKRQTISAYSYLPARSVADVIDEVRERHAPRQQDHASLGRFFLLSSDSSSSESSSEEQEQRDGHGLDSSCKFQ